MTCQRPVHTPCLNCSFLHSFRKYLRNVYCESLLKLQIPAVGKIGGPVFAGLTRHVNRVKTKGRKPIRIEAFSLHFNGPSSSDRHTRRDS